MTSVIIIVICVLLLIAYIFDLTSARTKIPSVVLLLLLGWGVRQLIDFAKIRLPDFTLLLPILGTIGLILIVLEGTLELKFSRSKISLIKKSLWGSLGSLLFSGGIIALLFVAIGHHSTKDSIVNAIPLCIISSAIAIPSVKNIIPWKKEFVIYESSFSDILGILFFTFFTINETINLAAFGKFGMQIILMLGISFMATFMLSYLLHRIQHHIKFIPIILLIILIYSISKTYHLPALLFILIFGLFLGNLDRIKEFKYTQQFHLDVLEKETVRFKELITEATFLVRTIFFLVFGYLMENSEITNHSTFIWALAILAVIYLLRYIQLRLYRLPLMPLLFIAPRGLITILLFLSVDPAQSILTVNKSLIIQLIILTSLIMMAGLMASGKEEPVNKDNSAENNQTLKA